MLQKFVNKKYEPNAITTVNTDMNNKGVDIETCGIWITCVGMLVITIGRAIVCKSRDNWALLDDESVAKYKESKKGNK